MRIHCLVVLRLDLVCLVENTQVRILSCVLGPPAQRLAVERASCECLDVLGALEVHDRHGFVVGR